MAQTSKSFRERTQDFWKTFEKEEKNIRRLMDKKTDSDTLVSKMNKILKKAFHDLPFEMGHNGEKHELILSPNGNKLILIQIQHLLKHKPKDIDNIWNFYEAKPAMGREGVGLRMYDKEISSEDLNIYTDVDEDRKLVNIEVYMPKLKDLDENLQYNALFVLLDLFIGELYTMEYIGTVDIIHEEKDIKSISLAKLRSYIDYLISEHEWDKNENPSDTWIGYENQANEDSEVLREDVFVGYTNAFELIRELGEEEIYPLEQFRNDGIFAGYIFYNNESVPQENMVPQRTEIEDKINELVTTQGIAQNIGGATGYQNSYLDYIIYDFEAFIKIAKEVMLEYNFTPKGLALFDEPNNPMYF